MAKDKKKAGVGIGIGLAALAAYFLMKEAEAHPEYIVLSDLVISPAEVYVGETVDISLVATNVGDKKATKQIICEVE